ncbi:hypothetical protein [Alkalihalobacterium sp. APHAB7]|uniref:hypothetical protein n=1 Tax=Alkalihalobacterium sp. APHAB7 TaxID=3402081 RepID=UPI003AAB735D
MKRFLIVSTTVLVLLISFIGLRFGSALFQEERPLLMLYTVMKLEFSDHDFELISDTSTSKRYISKTRVSSEEIFHIYMSERGWNFKEQMGSGFIFEKDGMVRVVTTRMYTRHYFIWSVPNEI